MAFNPANKSLKKAQPLEPQEISLEVLSEKYAKGGENLPQIRRRIAVGVAEMEKPELRSHWADQFAWAMDNGFIPAGRINSAAGTEIKATLINCFVQPVGDAVSEDKDGKPSIYKALAQSAETMRRGGGVGYNFSAIRPKSAKVKGTHSQASGPISYMRVFDRSCETVESAGARRGAQMGMLNIDHPDIEDFIHAKDKGDLTNFNISVAVSNRFMQAVESDTAWELVHKAEPSDDLIAAGAHQRADGLWIYRTVKARDLWNQIMESTYDHAEPGIIFIDTVNQDNSLAYCEVVEATNPCVTGDTRLHTSRGMVRIDELYESQEPISATVDLRGLTEGREIGSTFKDATPAFMTSAAADIYELTLDSGHKIKATEWHKFHVGEKGEFVALKDLSVGDDLWLLSGEGGFGSDGSAQLGEVLGIIAGDGHFTNRGKGMVAARIDIWDDKEGVADRMLDNVNALLADEPKASNGRKYHSGISEIKSRRQKFIRSVQLASFLEQYGFNQKTKLKVPEIVWTGSRSCVVGYLRALFYADGTVQRSDEKSSCDIRLSSVNAEFLREIQMLLSNFGIFSKIHHRRKAGDRKLPDGKGARRNFSCQDSYDLIVGGAHRDLFMKEIGFLGHIKNEKANAFISTVNSRSARHVSSIASIRHVGVEAVYDVTQHAKNSIVFNGIATSNCAEQPLPPYGCCCLGSLNLTLFVKEPFGDAPSIDFDALSKVAAVAVRMLDNILDLTYWPLPEQVEESRNKRRIGIGYTGLGDALAMLKLRYNSPAALEMGAEITKRLRDACFRASSALAVEKGSFRLFDAEQYLSGGFAQKLPEDVRQMISKQGLRNSHLLSIAPTGTISLAFADNASNGIEPPFSWTYNRKKRMPDGSFKTYPVEDYAWRLYRSMGGDVSNLPDYFVTALEMSAIDHMNMVAAAAPYCDSAISKTVNVPEDYPYEQFKDLYFHAWKAGLKGLATYRPNLTLGSVLSVASDAAPAAAKPVEDFGDETNRRISIKSLPEPVLGSLRWPDRPKFASGNSSWTFMVDHPDGEFALFVGEADESEVIERGQRNKRVPFEIWIQGRKAPSGLGALAKTLSIDMRCADREWVLKKLNALAKTPGEAPFSIAMPPDGGEIVVASACQAIAKIILWRSEALGVFDSEDPTPEDEKPWRARTPLLDALFSPKEPKTGPGGTMGWFTDVLNPATGDDFVLGLKEITLPDGTHRPYSMWLSGSYPKSLDGLCKLLSLDMRVVDPSWISLKLRKLTNYAEPLAEFMAKIPGHPQGKQQTYPSTVAYIAALILHRYQQLGILDEAGAPVAALGLMSAPVAAVAPASQGLAVSKGKVCVDCGVAAVIKKDGCEFCTSCGRIGSCG